MRVEQTTIMKTIDLYYITDNVWIELTRENGNEVSRVIKNNLENKHIGIPVLFFNRELLNYWFPMFDLPSENSTYRNESIIMPPEYLNTIKSFDVYDMKGIDGLLKQLHELTTEQILNIKPEDVTFFSYYDYSIYDAYGERVPSVMVIFDYINYKLKEEFFDLEKLSEKLKDNSSVQLVLDKVNVPHYNAVFSGEKWLPIILKSDVYNREKINNALNFMLYSEDEWSEKDIFNISDCLDVKEIYEDEEYS